MRANHCNADPDPGPSQAPFGSGCRSKGKKLTQIFKNIFSKSFTNVKAIFDQLITKMKCLILFKI